MAAQEVVVVDVKSSSPDELQSCIVKALAEKSAHRIVSTTLTSYGEFPLYFRALIVIEYVANS
ncbi:MAG: hypothetical protein ACTIJ6_09870 [Leucobacter sp.]